MQNNKIIRILSVLTKEEMRSFESHLKNLFENKGDTIWSFFLFLKKQLNKSNPVLEKEIIFTHLYPKEPYRDEKMRKLIYRLSQQLESFILISEKKEDFQEEIHLLSFYLKHYLLKEQNEVLTELNKKLAASEQKNMLYWEAQTQAAIFQSYQDASQYKYTNNLNIPNIIYHQTICFFAQQLKWHFCLLANQKLLHKPHISPFFQHIMSEIEINPQWQEIEIIKVYYYANLLFQNKEDLDVFYYLRKFVLEDNILLEITEKALIAASLRNYLVHLASHTLSLNETLFELYIEHLAQGWLFSNNKLSPQGFRNFVNIGCELGKVAEVKQFITEYEVYLPDEWKENLLILANAYISLAEKKYNESLKYLSILEKFHYYLIFELNARVMKIQNLCALAEFELCVLQINSFKVYIHRHDDLNQHKKDSYNNFAKFVLKYCDILPNETEKRQVLYAEIESSKQTVKKAWLLSLLQR